MATLTPTLKLISAAGQATSDALSFSLTKALTVVAPSVGLSKITATTTAADSIIVPSLDARRYLFAHNTGVDSSGSDTTSEVYIESELGRIGKLDVDEFLFMPLDSNGVNKIQLKATSGTVVVEYAYWTKG
jgi:hypothetical protein